jgi:hypothetical protein
VTTTVTPEQWDNVRRRIRERRAYTAAKPNEAIDADTDMMVLLLNEADSANYAAAQLRTVVDELRASRAVELIRDAPSELPRRRSTKTPRAGDGAAD